MRGEREAESSKLKAESSKWEVRDEELKAGIPFRHCPAKVYEYSRELLTGQSRVGMSIAAGGVRSKGRGARGKLGVFVVLCAS